MGEKSTSFQYTFFDIIAIGEKSMSFWCTFFKVIYVLFWCNFDWLKTDTTLACLWWRAFERQGLMIVLISLFDKFSIYYNWKLFECLFSMYFRSDVRFQRNHQLAINTIEQRTRRSLILKWHHRSWRCPSRPLKPWVQTSNRYYTVQGVGRTFQDLRK